MIDLEKVCPQTYAAHLATYIGDPSTIRIRTREAFGIAPSLEQCRRYRDDVTRKSFRAKVKPPTFGCGHSNDDANTVLTINGNYRCRTCTDAANAKAEADRLEREDRNRQADEAERRERKLRQESRLALIAANRDPDYIRPRLATATLDRVAFIFKTTVAEMKGPRRNRSLVNARAVAATVFREAGLSYPQIARILNKDCHSSIINLCRVFKARVGTDSALWEAYEALRS